MNNDLMYSEEQMPASNANIQVEQTRAMAEVQSQMIIAKKFPRDIIAAQSKIIETCKRFTLAEKAFYSYPRGGQTISGPSIRLAEVLAQNYQNLVFGVTEVERGNGYSIAKAYCWDLENNVTQVKQFEVRHEITLKDKKVKRLTDSRDIYELVANQGARRMRACILAIIPSDVVDCAVDQCKKTLNKGSGITLNERIRNIVIAFKNYGVSQEMIEKRLGHKIDLTTAEEIVDLTGIGNAIKDGQSKRGDFFDFPSDENNKLQELRNKVDQDKKNKEEAKNDSDLKKNDNSKNNLTVEEIPWE